MPDYPEVLAQNILEDCSVSYDATEDAIYKAQYVANRSRLSKFTGADTTPQHIVFDYGSAVSVDTFVLDREFVITGGSSQLLLQYSDNGADWTSLITLTKAGDLADNSIPVWKTFTAESHRYWRLRLTGLTAAPTIYNAWLGTRIQMTTGPYGPFDPWAEESADNLTRTPGGAAQVSHRYSKRTHRSEWRTLIDSQAALLTTWWTQARKYGRPWWWLMWPDSYSSNTTLYQPVMFVSPSGGREMPLEPTTRSTVIEGIEV